MWVDTRAPSKAVIKEIFLFNGQITARLKELSLSILVNIGDVSAPRIVKLPNSIWEKQLECSDQTESVNVST